MLMIVFLLLTGSFFGAPCSIAPNRLYPLSDVTKCLRGIPYNTSSAEIRNLIPTLKSYYENNPFVDWFRSPPPGYEKFAFDFEAEIDAISAKSYADGFDFYRDLDELFLKFKDGHALFLPPCLWNYYYALPFDITVINGDTDDDFLTPYFYIDGAVSGATDVNIEYAQIIGIDFEGGNNFTNISKAVSDFALKYGSVQYNNHALWNHQIVLGFFGLNVAFYPLPVNNNVTLQVILENKTAVTTVTVSWYGIYAGESRPSSLNNLCPLRAQTASDTITPSATAGTEDKGESEEKKKSAKEMFKEMKKRIVFGGEKKKAGGKAGRKDIRPRNDNEAMEIIRKAMPRSSEFDMARLRRNHRAWAQAQAQAQITPQTPATAAPAQTQAQPQSPAKYSLRKDADIQPKANMLRRGKALARNTKERKDNGRSFSKLSNEDNLYALLEDEDNQLYFYVVPERHLGIVRLLSFSVEDDKTFFEEFVQWFDRMSKMEEKIENVVIDVRGNNGGSLELLEVLMRYLFPTLRPADIETSMAKTTFLNDWEIVYEPDEDEPTDSIWYAWNTTTPVDNYYAGSETRSFRYLNGTTYTKSYTKRYLWDVQYYDFNQLDSYSPYDPQHVYIISDGQCYSACGVFTKLAQDTHAAKVLGYSFNPFYIDREGLDLYNPGSCPGLELDSETLDDIRDTREYAQYFNDFKNFPAKLPRDDEIIGWTQSESYSINPLTRNQTLYFKNNTVDDVIPLFSNYLDGNEDNLLNIAWYIDEAYVQPQYCFDWEVKVDSNCAAPAGSHQVWGHPCKNEGFDTSTCAFASCEKGYFVSAVGECSPLPYWQDGR